MFFVLRPSPNRFGTQSLGCGTDRGKVMLGCSPGGLLIKSDSIVINFMASLKVWQQKLAK